MSSNSYGGMSMGIGVIIIVLINLWLLPPLIEGYRILESGQLRPNGSYFRPFDKGFVGVYGDPSNLQRERINEGALETPDQELIFEGPSPRQVCPNMVGPFSDGNYYCSAREYGYCDRRSGTCFCNIGYQGIDCSECQGSHYKVGNLCFPKKLCPNDCNGAGTCNYNNGTCSCLPHRTGESCETMLCSQLSPLCAACTPTECLFCSPGYYLTGNASKICSSCYDFDPRCAGCTKEIGCSVCADPILTSVRRSGYRSSDPQLPIEENNREFSITLPFGTKSPESFADAENFFVCATPANPLNKKSTSCVQGPLDESWKCQAYPASHIVCGHYGVFRFEYPNYVISEGIPYIYMTVIRSGGGYGNVTINYFIKHIFTDDSDVTATAPYTTSLTLSFDEGIVSRSFLVTINDDPFYEPSEVFQVVLETPVGGGSIGAQFRTNVTIIDDDLRSVSPLLTVPLVTSTTARAGHNFTINIQAVGNDRLNQTTGGAMFLSVIENDLSMWTSAKMTASENEYVSPIGQRNSKRIICPVTDNRDGTYSVSGSVKEQGHYQLRTWVAFPGGLVGHYYSDAFFSNLVLTRVDRYVNYTWGTGKILPRGSDYLSIRWIGAIMPPATGTYYFKVEAQDHVRLWINGDLLVDHFHGQAANMEPTRAKFLIAQQLAEIVIEYRKIRGAAHARLTWATPLQSSLRVIPTANLYGLYEISRSPVDVHIISDDTSAATTECTGKGLFEAEALVVSKFSVCPRDKYGNLRDDDDEFYLSTQLFNSRLTLVDDMGYNGQGSEIITPTLVYNPLSHCFDGTYKPERAGYYRLDIEYRTWRYDPSSAVAGSPFYLVVKPTKVSGPYSDIYHLSNPTLITAGTCWNFTIVARDGSKNRRLVGGDRFFVYMYQVADYINATGTPVPTGAYSYAPTKAPSRTSSPTTLTASPTTTRSPTTKPTSMPTQSPFGQYNIFQPLSDSPDSAIRYGIVSDLNNGSYACMICPIIGGWYETHVLVNSFGVSNQPFRRMDYANSLLDTTTQGRGSFHGQYVANSPYSTICKHASAAGMASTAEGPGLSQGIAGVQTWFILTARDAWGNILRTVGSACTVSVMIQRSPVATSSVNIWNYNNGSYHIRYTPAMTGTNLLSIYVDGMHIYGSPFTVEVGDGHVDTPYTFAIGPGLLRGTTGVTQYFELFAYDLDGNRKSVNTDRFIFIVSGANNFTNVPLIACDSITDPEIASHCNPDEAIEGHYLGWFMPFYSGAITINVMLIDPVTSIPTDISNSPFTAFIHEFYEAAKTTIITGDIYDQIAGVDSHVYLTLYDNWKNRITYGGANIECVLLGVAVEWGTIPPYDNSPTPGLPNAHHYRGFYYYPNVYGIIVDHGDGTYVINYNAPKAGQYVMRIALTEPGLNVTYFNNTNLGYLFDGNHALDGIAASRGYPPINFGSSISWTGDIGGRSGAQGDRTLDGTYYDRFATRTEPNIDFNLRYNSSLFRPYNRSDAAVINRKFNFREAYWSARWVGLITPEFAEEYIFTIDVDPNSHVRLYVGGVGSALNCSNMGQQVISGANQSSYSGIFFFSDVKPREIVLEYIHYIDESYLSLYWHSLSTPRAIVPNSAFSHWVNISHYNTTIHPNKLCPHCSTVYGEGLHNATVAKTASFILTARDDYGNLLQRGGDVPSAFAVGRDGILFRGEVTDYGNSTYLIEYIAVTAGEYLLYVTVGCCPPHPNVGMQGEIEGTQGLLVMGAPFKLTVKSTFVDYSRSIVTGYGAVGGTAGFRQQFTISYRDIYNNPTSFIYNHNIVNNSNFLTVQFVNVLTRDVVSVDSMQFDPYASTMVVSYNMTTSGSYFMSVTFKDMQTYQDTHVMGSPFHVVITPDIVFPAHTVLTGLGMKQAVHNKTTAFRVELHDRYRNSLNIGGTRLYTRVDGDAAFSVVSKIVVPVCIDNRDGVHICSYTAQVAGYHRLIVRVLKNIPERPVITGGSGLVGKYHVFTSNQAYSITNAINGELDITPTFTRVDAAITLSWPDGYMVPTIDKTTGSVYNIPITGPGATILWTGYLVSPVSDVFTLSLETLNLNGSIALEGKLLFDQQADGKVLTSNTIALQANAAYEISVRVNTPIISDLASSQLSRYVSLRWSHPNMKVQPIPGFFLYPTAEEIYLSPFPVTVV